MGDPKKQRKKYKGPKHPWLRERVDEEKGLLEKYGLKNKKEIWKAESMLRNFKDQAKRLIARYDEQSKKEKKELLERLTKLNLVKKGAKIEDVLGITLNDILDRRLQTILYKNKLARTIDQARQFIIHNHVFVNGKKVNVPSYIVLSNEESKINFDNKSSLANLEHPERIQIKQREEKVEKNEKIR